MKDHFNCPYCKQKNFIHTNFCMFCGRPIQEAEKAFEGSLASDYNEVQRTDHVSLGHPEV